MLATWFAASASVDAFASPAWTTCAYRERRRRLETTAGERAVEPAEAADERIERLEAERSATAQKPTRAGNASKEATIAAVRVARGRARGRVARRKDQSLTE